jgi:hypothetical protein
MKKVEIGDIVNIKRDDFYDIDGGEYKVTALDEEEIFLRKSKLDMNDSGLRLDLDYFYNKAIGIENIK